MAYFATRFGMARPKREESRANKQTNKQKSPDFEGSACATWHSGCLKKNQDCENCILLPFLDGIAVRSNRRFSFLCRKKMTRADSRAPFHWEILS
jgi:hypothetical protein